MDSVLVEIVCQSVADAREAELGGAHRIELCVGLTLGGLTPTLALLEGVKATTSLPVMAMVRPRPGGFVYDSDELTILERDSKHLLAQGADGLVFGLLNLDFSIAADACRPLLELARAHERETVFHRAFDLTPDPFAALDTLIDLGVTRVLTSGQKLTALDGAEMIQRLIVHAAGRIQILPGGGIRAYNVRALRETTGTNQIHLAPLTSVTEPPRVSEFGNYSRVEATSVAAVIRSFAPPAGEAETH